MFDKNALPYGLSLGFLVPALVFGLLLGLFSLLSSTGAATDANFRPYFTERTSAIVAIGVNAILINQFYKRRKVDSMRGIVIATFVLVMAWLYFFAGYIF